MNVLFEQLEDISEAMKVECNHLTIGYNEMVGEIKELKKALDLAVHTIETQRTCLDNASKVAIAKDRKIALLDRQIKGYVKMNPERLMKVNQGQAKTIKKLKVRLGDK